MTQMNMLRETEQNQTMWVVFSGETEFRLLKWFLKRGFRHCYALINDGSRWITCDPLAHKTDIHVHHQVPADFDLPGWLEQRGLIVKKVHMNTGLRKALPPALFTCVEAVKRVIGLRKWWVFTPYQLFKTITI